MSIDEINTLDSSQKSTIDSQQFEKKALTISFLARKSIRTIFFPRTESLHLCRLESDPPSITFREIRTKDLERVAAFAAKPT